LIFLEESGRNRTPDKLRAAERDSVTALCDSALRQMVKAIGPRHAIGVGNFAEARAREALRGTSVCVGRILHPSPASPAANGNWAKVAVRQLAEIGIKVP
jgi:single-strand selective monofunctional uracil DNA glycosylase